MAWICIFQSDRLGACIVWRAILGGYRHLYDRRTRQHPPVSASDGRSRELAAFTLLATRTRRTLAAWTRARSPRSAADSTANMPAGIRPARWHARWPFRQLVGRDQR